MAAKWRRCGPRLTFSILRCKCRRGGAAARLYALHVGVPTPSRCCRVRLTSGAFPQVAEAFRQVPSRKRLGGRFGGRREAAGRRHRRLARQRHGRAVSLVEWLAALVARPAAAWSSDAPGRIAGLVKRLAVFPVGKWLSSAAGSGGPAAVGGGPTAGSVPGRQEARRDRPAGSASCWRGRLGKLPSAPAISAPSAPALSAPTIDPRRLDPA